MLRQIVESLEGAFSRTLHDVIIDPTDDDQGTIDKCHNDLVAAIKAFEVGAASQHN